VKRFGNRAPWVPVMAAAVLAAAVAAVWAGGGEGGEFPQDLQAYAAPAEPGVAAVLLSRAREVPFNLAASLIFLAAIVHTFLAGRFLTVAHRWEQAHEERKRRGEVPRHSVSHGAELFHFLGEIEVVFGLWAVALVAAIVLWFDWATAVGYITRRVNFTEALFVVVIMTLASTRPILKLAEASLQKIAALLGGSLAAWWLTILTVAPLLGSLTTEPAAMTIAALLLGKHFYPLNPSRRFKYATLGLLFVNISVGGVLTHFAAPPVLMVAGPWQWDTAFMLVTFGWKAVAGILLSNGLIWLMFRRELAALQEAFAVGVLKGEIQARFLERELVEAELDRLLDKVDQELNFRDAMQGKMQAVIEAVRQRLEARYLESIDGQGIDAELARKAFQGRFEEILRYRLRRSMPALLPADERAPFVDPDWDLREDPVPAWVTVAHLLFMGWTVFNVHHPEIFVPGILFFLGFAQVTAPFQNRIDLKPPLLVGFFLGGLVIHGGLQGWWIEPVLGSLSAVPLMLGATVLTAFNDNAAITYLSTLVPGFTDALKYAVVAGAVAGGGLTVIANAPNPAGQALLRGHFEDGFSPVGLLKGALLPTVIVWLVFYLGR
jgi:hypothetical protein